MENIHNHISVIGKICSAFVYSHEVYGEGFYRFDLEIDRLSDTTDILPVTISDRIIDRAAMTPGAMVNVTGQIRSYNNYVEADRRNKLVLTVFARDIMVIAPEFATVNPNDAYLNGFICKPPVYRTTPFGREIADLLLAVNRSYGKSDYIPCIAWGRNARFAGGLAVGDNIQVWGRMQSRPYQKRYENGDIVEKTAFEVSISKLEAGKSQKNASGKEEDTEEMKLIDETVITSVAEPNEPDMFF